MTIYLWEFPDCKGALELEFDYTFGNALNAKGALELEFDYTFGNALNAKVHLILNVTIPLGMP